MRCMQAASPHSLFSFVLSLNRHSRPGYQRQLKVRLEMGMRVKTRMGGARVVRAWQQECRTRRHLLWRQLRGQHASARLSLRRAWRSWVSCFVSLFSRLLLRPAVRVLAAHSLHSSSCLIPPIHTHPLFASPYIFYPLPITYAQKELSYSKELFC